MMTPEILRVLATGCDRLNDGDPKDRALVQAVAKQVYLQEHKVWDGRSFVSPSEVTSGYIKGPEGSGVDAWVDVKGQWRWQAGLVTPGTEVYLYEECTLFVCPAVDRP
jgi:hypothetical protein